MNNLFTNKNMIQADSDAVANIFMFYSSDITYVFYYYYYSNDITITC